jgi:hypothetical protein
MKQATVASEVTDNHHVSLDLYMAKPMNHFGIASMSFIF